MSLLQENVYFFYRKVNKNAYFCPRKVNKNVNLVIFNMSKIAFCRFATLVVIVICFRAVLIRYFRVFSRGRNRESKTDAVFPMLVLR